MPAVYPFSAIVGQTDMKLALLVAAVDPTIGGVLVFGDRGTGKSTAVRSLAALLPRMKAVAGCVYHCDPDALEGQCEACRAASNRGQLKTQMIDVPVVDRARALLAQAAEIARRR
jgi:magnesium chelatase subunit I